MVGCSVVWLVLVDCDAKAGIALVVAAGEVGVVAGVLAAEMFMPYVGAGSGSLAPNPSKCSLLDSVAALFGTASPYIMSGANVTANPYVPLDGVSELEAWASQCSDADALPLWHPGNGQL